MRRQHATCTTVFRSTSVVVQPAHAMSFPRRFSALRPVARVHRLQRTLLNSPRSLSLPLSLISLTLSL